MLRILANNLHDTATLAADNEIMPVGNTQRSERSLVWRSPSSSPQVLTGNLAAATHIDCCGVFRHNLGVSGEFRLELIYQGNVVYDSGVIETAELIPAGVFRAGIDPWGASQNDKLPKEVDLLIHWLPTSNLADSYRITLKASSYQPVMDIGRLFLGASFSVSVNYLYGASLQWLEDVEHKATEGGSLRSIGGGEARRKIDLKLDWLSESDRQLLVTNLIKFGKAGDLLVSMHPKATGLLELEHTLICRRINDFSHTQSTATMWQSALQFLEV